MFLLFLDLPTNQSCFTATEMTPNTGTECTNIYPGNTAGVEQITNDYCALGYSNWFHFTAINPVNILEIQNYVQVFGEAGLTIELFEGADCLNLNYLNCQGITGAQTLPLLVAGHEYYLKIISTYNSGAIFDICLKSVTPPANDLCNNATPLTVSPNRNVQGLLLAQLMQWA